MENHLFVFLGRDKSLVSCGFNFGEEKKKNSSSHKFWEIQSPRSEFLDYSHSSSKSYIFGPLVFKRNEMLNKRLFLKRKKVCDKLKKIITSKELILVESYYFISFENFHTTFLYESKLQMLISTVGLVVRWYTGILSARVLSLWHFLTFSKSVWLKRDSTCPKLNNMTLCNLRHWSKTVTFPFSTPEVKGFIS